jgi:eukaryotic-like serine/threonine-protein kinase
VAQTRLQRGAVVDSYEIQRYVRRGPAGAEEYDGVDNSLKTHVTVLAFASGAVRPDAVGTALAGLRHPHIAPVAAVGEAADVPYVVYECESRQSLEDVVLGRGMADDRALEVLTMIAEAVDAAHRKGVVHGDLEPSTVLMTADGEPIVTGIGLAPLMQEEAGGDSFQSIPEVAGFIAPEEAERSEFAAAADRYSFAGIAYEVLSGSRPFAGSTAADVLDAQLSQRPGLGAARTVRLGPAATRVLRKGLAPRPEMRWQTCRDMVDALRLAIVDDVAAARAPQAGRRRWLVVGVAVLALIGLAALFWASRRPPPAATPAVTLSESVVEQGAGLLVGGSGLPANQVGTIELESNPRQIGAFQADQNGNVSVMVTIPLDTTPGGHVVSVCWDMCHAGAKLTVTERASPAQTPSPSQSASPSPRPSPGRTPPSPAVTPSQKTAPSSSPS